MKNIFITATNTNIGKTYTSIKLLNQFSKMGYKVGAFKPIESGVENEPEDGKILLKTCRDLNSNFNNIDIDEICPIQLKLPAAPYIAKGTTKIDFDLIWKSYEKVKKECDILLIEGAGGLLVPIEKDLFMIDLIHYFNADALLVTGDKLGCINDTLLSLEALNNRVIKTTWCVNRFDKNSDFKTITIPFYKSYFKSFYTVQDDILSIANCYIDRDS